MVDTFAINLIFDSTSPETRKEQILSLGSGIIRVNLVIKTENMSKSRVGVIHG